MIKKLMMLVCLVVGVSSAAQLYRSICPGLYNMNQAATCTVKTDTAWFSTPQMDTLFCSGSRVYSGAGRFFIGSRFSYRAWQLLDSMGAAISASDTIIPIDSIKHAYNSIRGYSAAWNGYSYSGNNVKMDILLCYRDRFDTLALSDTLIGTCNTTFYITIKPVSNFYEGNKPQIYRSYDTLEWKTTAPTFYGTNLYCVSSGTNMIVNVKNIQFKHVPAAASSYAYHYSNSKGNIDNCFFWTSGATTGLKLGVYYNGAAATGTVSNSIFYSTATGKTSMYGIASNAGAANSYNNIFVGDTAAMYSATSADIVNAKNNIVLACDSLWKNAGNFTSKTNNASNKTNADSIIDSTQFIRFSRTDPTACDFRIKSTSAKLRAGGAAGCVVSDIARVGVRPAVPCIGPFEYVATVYVDSFYTGTQTYNEKIDFNSSGWSVVAGTGTATVNSLGLTLYTSDSILVEKTIDTSIAGDWLRVDCNTDSLYARTTLKAKYSYAKIIFFNGDTSWSVSPVLDSGAILQYPMLYGKKGSMIYNKGVYNYYNVMDTTIGKLPNWGHITKIQVKLKASNAGFTFSKLYGYTNSGTKGGYTLAFDDCNYGIYKYLMPMLKEYNIPIQVNVPTSWPGTDSSGVEGIARGPHHVGWDTLRYLQDTLGWEVGNHTKTHWYPTHNDHMYDSANYWLGYNEVVGAYDTLTAHGLKVWTFKTPGADNADLTTELANRNHKFLAAGQSAYRVTNTLPTPNHWQMWGGYPNLDKSVSEEIAIVKDAADFKTWGTATGHNVVEYWQANDSTSLANAWPVTKFTNLVEAISAYADSGKLEPIIMRKTISNTAWNTVTVSSYTPLRGPSTGGTTVTIYGTGLSVPACSVSMDGGITYTARITSTVDTMGTFVTPADSGSKSVMLKNADGLTTSVGSFVYQNSPHIILLKHPMGRVAYPDTIIGQHFIPSTGIATLGGTSVSLTKHTTDTLIWPVPTKARGVYYFVYDNGDGQKDSIQFRVLVPSITVTKP